MTYAASLSTLPDTSAATTAVCEEVMRGLNGKRPDLAFLFVSHAHAKGFASLAETIQTALGCSHLLGCTGESIAGGSLEIEEQPAISLWAASLPESDLKTFHVTFGRAADGIFCAGLPEFLPSSEAKRQTMFLLGEPFSCATDVLIERLADECPGLPLIGGMASGGHGAGLNRLFLNGNCLDSGAVGVLIQGGPRIRSIVSQGCRPIGTPFVVTRAELNLVHELGGKRTLERLRELFGGLSEEDRQLVQKGLHVGIVMNEYQEKFQRGDFLISNVIGADQESGSIGLGSVVRTGQTVQFHVRDAQTADEELRHLLERHSAGSSSCGASLLFSCNGRGTRLFAEANHDAGAIQAACGPIPLAGFFAQGELGLVGNKNYIHGFTASIALFDDVNPSESTASGREN